MIAVLADLYESATRPVPAPDVEIDSAAAAVDESLMASSKSSPAVVDAEPKRAFGVVANSTTLLFVVSTHVTVRVRDPVPHVLLQPPQLPDVNAYTGQASRVQALLVAGYAAVVHTKYGLMAPVASDSVANVSRQLTARVCVPEAHVTLHAPQASDTTQTMLVGYKLCTGTTVRIKTATSRRAPAPSRRRAPTRDFEGPRRW